MWQERLTGETLPRYQERKVEFVQLISAKKWRDTLEEVSEAEGQRKYNR